MRMDPPRTAHWDLVTLSADVERGRAQIRIHDGGSIGRRSEVQAYSGERASGRDREVCRVRGRHKTRLQAVLGRPQKSSVQNARSDPYSNQLVSV
jgi:hypothetical protein